MYNVNVLYYEENDPIILFLKKINVLLSLNYAENDVYSGIAITYLWGLNSLYGDIVILSLLTMFT